jgi:hypothetical protein
MTRCYGRSDLGSPLIEKVPVNCWQPTTFLGNAAIGFIAPLAIDGPCYQPVVLQLGLAVPGPGVETR